MRAISLKGCLDDCISASAGCDAALMKLEITG